MMLTGWSMPRAERPWWETGVVYQVYPRSFADSDGDGVGDLPGLTARLDHLAWLGVDAVWLSPFYRSPMRDFGYHISDHTDVDPLFGAPARTSSDCALSSTTCPTTRRATTRGSSRRAPRATTRSATGTSGATRSRTGRRRTTGCRCGAGRRGSGTSARA